MNNIIRISLLLMAVCVLCGHAQAQNATPRKVLTIPGACDPTGTKGDVILWKITTPNQGIWTCDPLTKVFGFQTNTFAASLGAKTMIYSNAAAAIVSTVAPTNGQFLIGDTGNIPALGTLTNTANETLITNDAHSITIGLAVTVKHKAASFFQLTDSIDVTKVLIFDLSNITPGQTRTVIAPDANSTLVQGGSAVANQFVTDVSTHGVVNRAQPTEANLSTSDITTNNVTSAKHGLAPKSPADATQFLNGAATPAFAAVKDSDLATTDVTTNNVASTKHGFAPKSPADATQFLNGAATPAFAAVKDSDLATTDVTTNNVASTKHGFAPKSSADATQFLNGAATPAFAAVKDSDLATTDVTTNNVASTKHGFAPKSPGNAAQFLNGAATPAFAQVNTTNLATSVVAHLKGDGSGVVASLITDDGVSLIGINDAAVGTLGGNVTTLGIKGLTAARGGGIRLRSSDLTLDAAYYGADGLFWLGPISNHPLLLTTNNVERMRIHASGGVSINTAVDPGAGVFSVNGGVKASSVRGNAVAFASLPASPVEGMMVPVTDSNTAAWGATIAGGGANHVLAYYNGTNWTVAAK